MRPIFESACLDCFLARASPPRRPSCTASGFFLFIDDLPTARLKIAVAYHDSRRLRGEGSTEGRADSRTHRAREQLPARGQALDNVPLLRGAQLQLRAG